MNIGPPFALPQPRHEAQDTVVALNALATYAIAAGQSVDVTLQATSVIGDEIGKRGGIHGIPTVDAVSLSFQDGFFCSLIQNLAFLILGQYIKWLPKKVELFIFREFGEVSLAKLWILP